MFKKTLAVTALAGALVLGTAAAASAGYPGGSVTANPNPIAPGGVSTVTATGIPADLECAAFYLADGPDGGDGVIDPADTIDVVGGSAQATFTATVVGTYTVEVWAWDCTEPPLTSIVSSTVQAVPADTFIGAVDIAVQVAAPSPSASAALPPTGSEIPAAAIWLGVGAVGIGAIAVTAAVARRRAAGNR